jgi:hypothetical protein
MTEQLRVGLVLDCRDPQVLAPFWEAALGYVTLGAVGNYWGRLTRAPAHSRQ